MTPDDVTADLPVLGRYRVLRKLGEGGMGVVYAAADDRLDREVAVKVVRPDIVADRRAIERFWREARAAARLSHPNICHIHELGEHDGRPFLVMELLQGESLADRLARERPGLDESFAIMAAILAALDGIHQQGLVHRDLKPSNVFLSAHGIKLLDFGLARSIGGIGDETQAGLTMTGTLVGTPQYMAPEQVQGEPLTPAVDLFAAGLILFELVAGRPAFTRESLVKTLHAVAHEAPPALVGGPAVAAIDRVVSRALRKRPADRYPAARDMAEALREAATLARGPSAPRAIAMTRVAVLPFRLLRDDPELAFLGVGLPDAIVTSLSRLESLVVRSSLQSARFGSEVADLERIARDLAVDVVVAGTLLPAGDQLRVSAQLLGAPAGEVLWSDAWTAPRSELFTLQDAVARRIVQALPVTRNEPAPPPPQDRPQSARAYELYLRANQLSYEPTLWRRSWELYTQCVQEDPEFAPAWARLGRLHRVFAKYELEDAEPAMAKAKAAFDRALALSPDLPLAHNLVAHYEVEMGRVEDALRRLLALAASRRPDPDLLAGLVHACRYVGLVDASCAAHELAQRLDPNAQTSVLHTWFMMGRYDLVAAEQHRSTDPVVGVALAAMGRRADALKTLQSEAERFASRPALKDFVTAAIGALEGRRDEALTRAHYERTSFIDGEGVYYYARILARLGDREQAMATLARTVDLGFACGVAFETDPWLDMLRSDPRFAELAERCRTRRDAAARLFIEAGGEAVLGVHAG